MRRISSLLFRAPQVTYVYVRSYRGAHNALNCSHLHRFNGLDRATFVIVPHRRQGLINLCTLPSAKPRLSCLARISTIFGEKRGRNRTIQLQFTTYTIEVKI